MPAHETIQLDRAEVESSLLAVLLEVDTVREGATALLRTLAPALESGLDASDADSVALAARDRDGLSFHVLAELGAARPWPSTFEPRFSVDAKSGVDASTGAVVLPLRANGRVVGALLMVDAIHASGIQRDPVLTSLLHTAAAVIDALLARTDTAVRRREVAQRSVEAVIEGIAHQVANPITGASAIAQLLAEEIQDVGHRAAVKQISVELARAGIVLADLLDFQRQTGAHSGVLDLNSVVEGIARFRGYAIREHGILLDLQLSPRTLSVRGDARSLEHALLIVLQYAESQSRASVNRSLLVRVFERQGSEVCVEVTDSGPGTLPDLLSSYFDLRFRDEASRSTAEKPDLGLAASILRGSGGRLEARGSKSEGTTLTMVLPRAPTGNYPALTTVS